MSQYTNDTQGGRLTGTDWCRYPRLYRERIWQADSIYYLLDHMGFS
ncbi:hypothetical protein [uncultured Vibrio sp.]|nr:hypothetical protein [uncultured Vibrio sp.]